VAVHALLCQLFYVDFVCGLPNSVSKKSRGDGI
jgi:hypothetical protein